MDSLSLLLSVSAGQLEGQHYLALTKVAQRPRVGIIWRLMLSPTLGLAQAVSWDISWSCWLELLASSCGPGFLTTWWLGSKSDCPKRERVRWVPYHLLWPELGSQEHHFGYILFIEAGAKALPDSSGGETDFSAERGLVARLWTRVCGTRSIAVAIFGKYDVPQSPWSEKPRSYLFPGEEMKKLGQIQIPSIHLCN